MGLSISSRHFQESKFWSWLLQARNLNSQNQGSEKRRKEKKEKEKKIALFSWNQINSYSMAHGKKMSCSWDIAQKEAYDALCWIFWPTSLWRPRRPAHLCFHALQVALESLPRREARCLKSSLPGKWPVASSLALCYQCKDHWIPNPVCRTHQPWPPSPSGRNLLSFSPCPQRETSLHPARHCILCPIVLDFV